MKDCNAWLSTRSTGHVIPVTLVFSHGIFVLNMISSEIQWVEWSPEIGRFMGKSHKPPLPDVPVCVCSYRSWYVWTTDHVCVCDPRPCSASPQSPCLFFRYHVHAAKLT